MDIAAVAEPDRRFETIDEAAEELVPVQPPREDEVPHSRPRGERRSAGGETA